MWHCLENTLKRTLSLCLYSPLTWGDIEALVISLMSTPEHSAELSTNSKILWTLSPKARFSKPSRSIIFVKEYSHPWDEMGYLRPDEDEICSIQTSVDPRWFLNDHDWRRTKDRLLFPQTVPHPSLNLRPKPFYLFSPNVVNDFSKRNLIKVAQKIFFFYACMISLASARLSASKS